MDQNDQIKKSDKAAIINQMKSIKEMDLANSKGGLISKNGFSALQQAALLEDEKLKINPIYVPTQLPIFVIDLKKLLQPHMDLARQAIDELRVTHPDSPVSNVSACYMSPWKSHLINPKLKPICDSVITIAKIVSHQVLSADLAALNMNLVVSDCWGIIYEQSDNTKFHNHFPAEYGCAIYLEAEQNCAPIIFSKIFKFQPEAGMMVLFPGILNHEVPANDGKRVVLSMNLVKTYVN